jgi:hypothetical protein
VFGVGEGGKLILICHRCGASKETFAAIMSALNLETYDAFPDDENREEDLAEYPLREAIRRHNEHYGKPEPLTRPPFVPPDLIDRFTTINSDCVETLRHKPAKLTQLAAQLGVPADALLRLSVGWLENYRVPDECGRWVDAGGAWTFPERAGRSFTHGFDPGPIIGIMLRFENPTFGKRVIGGGMRGLYIPQDHWDFNAAGPLLVPEGASDTAAIIGTGRCAVGRPSARGGVAHLAELFRLTSREIVILGENDAKPDGRWPGREGMEHVADELARRLNQTILRQLPPEGFKDAREFLRSSNNKEVSR